MELIQTKVLELLFRLPIQGGILTALLAQTNGIDSEKSRDNYFTIALSVAKVKQIQGRGFPYAGVKSNYGRAL
jgi:hypothetical protein